MTFPGLDLRCPVPEAAPAWRPLDLSLAHWVLSHGGPWALAQAAAWASCAEARGDCALLFDTAQPAQLGLEQADALEAALHALADTPGNGWLSRPASNTATATDTAPDTDTDTDTETDTDTDTDTENRSATADPDAPASPFVLDRRAFYLRRNFRDEIRVAHALRQRLHAPPAASAAPVDCSGLFGDDPLGHETPQRQAVQAALGQRLFVLSGGPGTGKTATVLRLLLAWTRRFRQQRQRAPRLCLAAPTGKAAQRLGQALQEGSRRLPQASAWQTELALVQDTEPGTLHRLLGSRGSHGGFAHHAGRPLPADLVLLDEASMIDLALLRALLDALPAEAALILVGDAEQLPPVGTGSALADLVEALHDHPALARLQHSFRANAALNPLNQAICAGDQAAFAAALSAAGTRLLHHPLPDPQTLTLRLSEWAQALHAGLEQAGVFAPLAADEPLALQRALEAMRQRQLLCALREGPFGAIETGHWLEQHLRQQAGISPASHWYPGRSVLITRNDAAAGLYNGDAGVCLQLRQRDGSSRLQVVFEPGPGDSAPRRFDPETLPAHESALALTVHKSQGSEYQRVAVLLPPQAEHPLLSRQLLYTAVSRAREAVELWAETAVIHACLSLARPRASRLVQRLREAD